MLTYAQIKLSRLIGLDGNSKKHSTSKTTASVLAHNFRDPVQVDLVFLPEEYQRWEVDAILADDSIKLTLVEGHDRTLNVCKTLFKQDANNPPGNIDVVKNKAGKVIDWLIPATVARSETRAKAVAYSIDHNATTAAALGDDALMSLFNSGDLFNQVDELLSEGESITAFDIDMDTIANMLMAQRDGDMDLDEDDEYDADDDEGDADDDLDDFDGESGATGRVQVGDIWQLGRHYLMCGDSLSEQNIKALTKNAVIDFIWADPPYGINIVKSDNTLGSSNVCAVNKYAPVMGDDTTDTAVKASKLYLELFPRAVHLWWGANHYANVLPPSPCWFVWDKNNTGDYADCELAWVNKPNAARLFKHTWNGMIKDSEHGQKRCHPTQKPVALAIEGFNLFLPAGAGTNDSPRTVLDPFLGSGISILAGEALGLTVYGLESSPDYCSISLERWEGQTGETAQLIYRE